MTQFIIMNWKKSFSPALALPFFQSSHSEEAIEKEKYIN